MDGLQFTQKVRRSPSYRQPWLPIVILSGYSDLPHILQARDAGATDFLTKPFVPITLFKRIVDVIERPRLLVQVESYHGPCRRRRKMDYDGPERRRADAPEVVDVPGEQMPEQKVSAVG